MRVRTPDARAELPRRGPQPSSRHLGPTCRDPPRAPPPGAMWARKPEGYTERGATRIAAYPGSTWGGAKGGQADDGQCKRVRVAGRQPPRTGVPRHGADGGLLHQRARHAARQDDLAPSRYGPALLLRLRRRRLAGLL